MGRVFGWTVHRAALFVVGVALMAVFLLHCQDERCLRTCQEGANFCSGTGVVACTFNPQTQCLEWQLKPCPNQQSCVAVPAPARCNSEQTCNDKYSSKKCVGQELYWFDNCGRQREKALICPPTTTCVGDSCVLEQGGCPQVCQANQTKCTSSGWISACIADQKGCFAWSTPIACPQGQVCQNGQCQQGNCPAPCTLGQTRCEGQGIQSCRQEANGCNDWGPVYPCLPGQACEAGQCIQEQCPGQCQITADCDKPVCGERRACVNGFCAKPPAQCQDKCILGQTRCDQEKLQACRREAHGCTDWGPPFRCLQGQTCLQGVCVQESCPQQCASDNDCNKAACGARRACLGGTCQIPQGQCPPSCTQDGDCSVAACGSRTACINGICGQRSNQCPPSCSQDSDCNIPPCGTWIACVGGRCGAPQGQCPASCSQDSQCAVAACGNRNQCGGGVCRVPATPDAGPPESQPEPQPESQPEPQPDTPGSAAWKYGNNVQFIQFPKQNSRTNSKWGPVLTDIVNHEAPNDSNSYTDLVTLGHETTHGINAYLRNNYNKTGKKANAFYVLQGRAAIVVEPNMRKSAIAAFVPTILRESRYNLYITGSTSWDDRPLYIFDEWVGYFNGGSTGVDLHKLGLWTYPWRDAAMGPLEFTIYGIATAMAVEKNDPTYFTGYPQFLEFTAWLAAESMKVYREGSVMTKFMWTKQDTHYQNFQTHADAKPMRDFCVRVFGQKWVDNVIFGRP